MNKSQVVSTMSIGRSIEDEIYTRKLPPSVKPSPGCKLVQAVLINSSIVIKNSKSSVIYRGNTDKKLVCLTFDDCPDNLVTPQIISILDSYGIKGSFFCIGNRLKKSRPIVKKAYEEGHLILNHSWNHPDLSHLNSKEVTNQITWTENQIFSIIGKRPAIIRTPYGTINGTIIKAAYENNCKIALWSIDTRDWTGNTPDEIVQRALSGIKPGSIILMHSYQARHATVEALPKIISKLLEMGYNFIDIGQMLNTNPYKN
jgi:peptidoglycan/xylan/chitin deacetylase (PgdA/CDA1 family)